MKIAFVTNNGSTISQHYGKAKYFEVVELRDNKVISRERREKPRNEAHQLGVMGIQMQQAPEKSGQGKEMAELIKDCRLLISKGIGEGALNKLRANNIEILLTDETEIDSAIDLYLQGKLEHKPERMHSSFINFDLNAGKEEEE